MPSTFSRQALLYVATVLPLLSGCRAQQCYFPDGSAADMYAPCGSNIKNCCFDAGPSYNDACFSNGLCHSWVNGYTYRGACTDKDWGDGCFPACQDSASSDFLRSESRPTY